MANARIHENKTTSDSGELATIPANSENVPKNAIILINPKKIPTPNKVVKIKRDPSIKFSLTLLGDSLQKITHNTAAMIKLIIGTNTGIGKLLGNPEKSMEDIKLPSYLDFLKDTTIISGLVVTITSLIVYIMVPLEVKVAVFGTGVDAFIFMFTSGMIFAAGVVVLLLGVRMMLAEIVPAFNGIANKLVPNSVPALDIPLVFPYGPNSLLVSFIISIFVSLIAMFSLNMTGWFAYALIPMTIACYFDVAPGAIFANLYGGRKAVIVHSVVSGVLMMVLVGLAIPLVGNTMGSFVQTFGANEFSVMAFIGDAIAKFFALFA